MIRATREDPRPSCRQGRDCRLCGMAALLAAAPVSSAVAASANMYLADTDALDESELGELRGTFNVGNFEMFFAVEVRSIIEGAGDLAGMVTKLNFDANGKISSVNTEVFGNGTTSESGTPSQSAGDTATLPVGTNLQSDQFQAIIGDAQTRVIHRISRRGLDTITQNTRDNVQVVQDTQIDVFIPNFDQVVGTFGSSRLMSNIGRDSSLLGLGGN